MNLLSLLLSAVLCTGAPDLSYMESEMPAHEYHVSKTNVRYVADREQVQVEMHVFVEDLEVAMSEAGAPRLELGTKNEHAESDRYLAAYLEKHFVIDWNGKDLPMEIVGWELEDDLHGLWVYLAADTPDTPRLVEVQNSVLTEYYADQANIVKLFNGQKRMATLLMNRDRTEGRYEAK